MPENVNHGRFWTYAKYPLAVISLIVLGWLKLAKWLTTEMYGGRHHWWHRIGGFVASVIAGSSTFYLIRHGGTLGFPAWGWNAYLALPHAPIVALEYALGAFALTAVYILPALWLSLLQWVWRGWKQYYSRVYKFFTRNVAGTGAYERNGTRIARRLTGFARITPGSKKLWEAVVKEQNDSFFIGFQSVGAYAVVTAVSAGAAYWLYGVMAMAVGAPSALAAVELAGIALVALLAFAVIVNPLWRTVDTGKTYVLGTMVSGVAAWGAYRWLTAFGLGWTGLGFGTALSGWLVMSYLYPAVTLALTDGMVKKLYKLIRPMVDSVYGEKETGFRQLVHQLLTLTGTALMIGLMIWLWRAVDLPLLPAVSWHTAHLVAVSAMGWFVVLPMVAFTTYALLGEALDWMGGNVITGAACSLGTAAVAAAKLGFVSWPHALLLTVPASFAVLLLTFLVAFPLAYGILRAMLELPLVAVATNAVGGFLHSRHKAAWGAFDAWVDVGSRLYRGAYKDQTPAFRQLANHTANIVVCLAVGVGVIYLLGSFGYSHTVSDAVAVVALLLSYLLGKRLVFRDSVQPIGSIKAIIKAILVGAYLRHATPLGLWFSIPFALVAASFVYFVFFPFVYLVARKLLDPWFTNWAVPKLDAVYNFVWRRLGFIVRWAEAVGDFLQPYFDGAIGALTFGWNLCMDAWNGVFGGNRKG